MTEEPVPVWERRRSGGAKLRRASISLAAILLGLAVLATSSGIFAALRQHFSAAGHPTPAATSVPWITPPLLPSKSEATLAMTGWQAIPVPEGGRSQIDFTPFPDDPASLFACAAVRNVPGQGPLAGPVKLWRSYNSGQQWQLLSLPKLIADTCVVRIAGSATRRILLLTHTTSPGGACLSPTILLSEDNGDTWTTLRPPHSSQAGTSPELCDAWASGPYLYWYEADTCPTGEHRSCDELVRSEDGGKSWLPADNGLTAGFFSPIWSDENGGETILAGYLSPQAATTSPPVTALWASNDAGDHWLPIQNFPHSALTNTYISLEPNVAESYPWNMIYRELIGPPATNLDNIVEAPGSQDGQDGQDSQVWMTLPPLPVPDTNAHHDGIAQVIGVASRGELLVFGPNPRIGPTPANSNQVGDIPPQPDRLWAWDPQRQQWEAAASALPVIPEEATISWGAGPTSTSGAWIWLISPSASGTELMRAFLA